MNPVYKCIALMSEKKQKQTSIRAYALSRGWVARRVDQVDCDGIVLAMCGYDGRVL